MEIGREAIYRGLRLSHPTSMNRRTLLVSTAAATATALAGCSALSDSGGNGSADSGGDEGAAEASGNVGVTRVTQEDVRVTVTDAFTASSLLGDSEYVASDDGSRYLLVNLQVRNNADEEKSIPVHEDLSVRDGEGIRQNQVTSGGSELTEPVGETYSPPTGWGGDAVIDPGSQFRGWVVYTVQADLTEFQIELPELLTKEDETVAWDVSLPADTGVVIEESVTTSEDPRSGRPVQVTASIANAGTRTGRIDRSFAVHTFLNDSVVESISGSVAPGETREVTIEFTPAKTGPYAVESTVREYDPVEVQAREFAFGEAWDLATGLEISVSDPSLTDSVTYDSSEGDGLTATPSAGNQFLVFDFEAEADDDHYWGPVFVAESGGEEANTFDGNRISHLLEGYDEELTSPPLGGPATGIGGVSDWPDLAGPMVMEVPSSFSTSDLAIHLRDDDTDDRDRYAATWTSA